MKRYFFLMVLTAVFMEVKIAASQTLEQVIEFSEGEYDCGNYALAACDFQRAWLFSGDSVKAALEERIADCFLHLEEYDRAAGFYQSALRKAGDDNIRNELRLDIAACHIHTGEFFHALADLDSLRVGKGEYLSEKKWFLTGICKWGINCYDEAFTCFSESIPDGNQAAREKIMKLKSGFFAIRHPNPRLAGWLSMIPGAGQFYCLEFGPGLNSLLLNGSLMLAGYSSLIVFRNNTLLLNLLPWIQRYYAGGIAQARGFAESKLRAKQNQFYQTIIDVIAESHLTK